MLVYSLPEVRSPSPSPCLLLVALLPSPRIRNRQSPWQTCQSRFELYSRSALQVRSLAFTAVLTRLLTSPVSTPPPPCSSQLAGAFIAAVVFVAKGSSKPDSTTATSTGKKSKSKKKKGSKTEEQHVDASSSIPPPPPPPQAKVTPAAPVPTKKNKSTGPSVAAPAPTPAPAPPAVAATSNDAPSFAAVASPTPAEAARVPKKQKVTQTAAEARLKPDLPTPVADMRDEEHDPTPKVARVMKVVGGKLGAQPKFEDDGWDEWNKAQEDEWEVAKPKSTFAQVGDDPRRLVCPLTCLLRVAEGAKGASGSSIAGSSSSAFAESNPAPRAVPGLSASAQTALNKKQRENQNRAAKVAAAKQDAEREQAERLAKHRRELERVR